MTRTDNSVGTEVALVVLASEDMFSRCPRWLGSPKSYFCGAVCHQLWYDGSAALQPGFPDHDFPSVLSCLVGTLQLQLVLIAVPPGAAI